jgi:hypothetical protein
MSHIRITPLGAGSEFVAVRADYDASGRPEFERFQNLPGRKIPNANDTVETTGRNAVVVPVNGHARKRLCRACQGLVEYSVVGVPDFVGLIVPFR